MSQIENVSVLTLLVSLPQAERQADSGDPIPLLRSWITEGGERVSCYALPVTRIPVDFFADPDGSWSFESLSRAAGFAVDAGVAVGALRTPFNGHPDGAAVVTLNDESRPYVAIVECPIAYTCVADAGRSQVSAA
jgi:hypothetical protein